MNSPLMYFWPGSENTSFTPFWMYFCELLEQFEGQKAYKMVIKLSINYGEG